VTRSAPWCPPVWTDNPIDRIRFLRELHGSGVVAHVVHTGRHRGAFVVDIRVTPPDLPEHRARISFNRGGAEPKVFVYGPETSPHRYSDGSICMWYPNDPPDRRWQRSDGARALLGHIVAHLVREHWWRQTGEWPGDEAPHGVATAPEQTTAAPR
jgi:hypothetical protein